MLHFIFPLRPNPNLCSRDSFPYTNKGCMNYREETSHGGPSRTVQIPRMNRKLDLHWISPEPTHLSSWREVWFQTPVRTEEVHHVNVPWMIHILGLDADEHIEQSMWLRALIAEIQWHNDTIIRGKLYHWAKSSSCGPPAKSERNPISLFSFYAPISPHWRDPMT